MASAGPAPADDRASGCPPGEQHVRLRHPQPPVGGGPHRVAEEVSDPSKLAETTAWLGAPVHRLAVPRIERGEQVASVTELVALGVALKTNWVSWLRDASDGLDIEGDRSEDIDLHIVLADLDRQLEGLRHSLRQAEEGPKQLNMPDALRERMIADAARYREMIDSLLSQRKMIESMLEGPGA